jgi:hypothetical protein
MRKASLFAGAAMIALGLTSCKNEDEKRAEVTINSYERYVDSVYAVNADDARSNWESIEASYNERIAEAEAALDNMKDRAAAEERLQKAKDRYAELKAKMNAQAAEAAQAVTPNRKQELRTAYFKTGNMGEDMDFSWVNKDNIVRVYNDFYNEFDKNKDNYSREDFDHIKNMYEALDAHKNTVEKEGLSSSDNMKIAEIKVKFAPKFKWNRMGAKADENADAKK